MRDTPSPDLQPLLRSPSPSSSSSYSGKPQVLEEDIALPNSHPSRQLEDDVLPETSTLGRNISWSSAYILVISRVIGSGIFATPGAILTSAGSPGLSLLLWLIGALIAACGLAVSLEYGCMLPRSGGNKVYLEFTYRWPRLLASTLIGIQVIFLGFTSGNCIIFSQYTLFALGREDASEFVRKGVAVGLLAFVTLIHGVFPKTGMKLQDILGWIKILVILFMILSGLYVVLLHPSPSPTPLPTSSSTPWTLLFANSNFNWGTISTALLKVFYSYAGLENVTNVLNEVRNPITTLKSVSVAAWTTASLMYLLVNVAYFLVVPVEEIKGSGELIAALFFERLFGRAGRTILPLAVSLSAVGNVMVVAFALARIKQEIARQGLLPFSAFLSSTKPFDSPLGGYLLTFLPSFFIIVLPPSANVYSFILDVEGYSAQLVGLAVACGLVLLRYRRPDLQRPFKTWYSAIWVKIALGIALLAGPFFSPQGQESGIFSATYAIVSIAIVLAGVVYWWMWTIVLPRWKGCDLEERIEVLDDGTSITKYEYQKKHLRRLS